MKSLSYQRFLRTVRAINCFIYLISKKIRVETIIPISCYCGAVIGLFRARELRSLDVSYIFFSRDAFPPNSYAVEWATNSWSLIHQIGYLGFSLGFDHRHMSLTISAVTGAAMVVGFALLIYSISRNGLVAILAAPLIAGHGMMGVFDADYEAQLIGSEHLSWQGSTFVILTLGVASVGFFRSAGFLAMLTTCIHLILGTWSVMLLGFLMAVLIIQKRFDSTFAILKGLSIGALLLVASYLVDKSLFTTESEFPADDHAFSVWSELWGIHRVWEFDILAIILAYIFGAILLWFIKFESRRNGNYDYTAALILFFPLVVSPLLYIAGHRDLGALSAILTQVIPGRFMMFNTFFVQILFAGILCRFNIFGIRRNKIGYLFLYVLMYLFLFYLAGDLSHVLLVAVIAVIAIAIVKNTEKSKIWHKSSAGRYSHATISTVAVVSLAGAILVAAYSATYSGVVSKRMMPIDHAAECKDVTVEGLVLAATYRQYVISQRRCALPALIDPWATNSLPYIPWAASEMRRIISVAYGVSLENPPVVTRNQGIIVESAFRQAWETRSAAEWVRIANEFGVGAVMVPPDWLLQLGAPIADGASFKLYSVR